jgi:hypothetical protein
VCRIKWAKGILIIMFLLCFLEMPYFYYSTLRIIAFILFIFIFIKEHKKYQDSNFKNYWSTIWVISALLINPIRKISFERDIWLIIDVMWICILALSILYQYNKDKEMANF